MINSQNQVNVNLEYEQILNNNIKNNYRNNNFNNNEYNILYKKENPSIEHLYQKNGVFTVITGNEEYNFNYLPEKIKKNLKLK